MKNLISSSKGFTLVETMVAVAILAISVAGPLVTANRAYLAAEIARDQLTASYLGQEGIEYVRIMRDNEYLTQYNLGVANASAIAWTDFLTDATTDTSTISGCVSSTCTLDPTQTMGTGSGSGHSLSPCSGGACVPLYLSSGIYNEQQTGTQQVFTRTIQATAVSASEEHIVSMVSWNFHGHSYSVTVGDHLTPWQ